MSYTIVMIEGTPVAVEIATEPVSIGAADLPADTLESVTSANRVADVGPQLLAILTGISTVAQNALRTAQPDSWSLEVLIGFKGEAGIPFISKGEANASIKVSATWKSA